MTPGHGTPIRFVTGGLISTRASRSPAPRHYVTVTIVLPPRCVRWCKHAGRECSGLGGCVAAPGVGTGGVPTCRCRRRAGPLGAGWGERDDQRPVPRRPGDADRLGRRDGQPVRHRASGRRPHRGPEPDPPAPRVLADRRLREPADGQRPRPPDAGAAVSGRVSLADGSRSGPAEPSCGTGSDRDRSPPPTPPWCTRWRARTAVVHPTWDVGVHLRPGLPGRSAELGGGDSSARPRAGYESTAGYVGYMLEPGARATWRVLGAPAGPAIGHLALLQRPGATDVDGGPQLRPAGQRSLPRPRSRRHRTDSAEPWSTLTTTVALPFGGQHGGGPLRGRRGLRHRHRHAVGVASRVARSQSPSSPAPSGGGSGASTPPPTTTLPTCSPGQTGATCVAGLEPLHTDGLLDTRRLAAAGRHRRARCGPRQGWVRPRRPDGDVEDGYLFVYGHDYTGALQHTGAADRARSAAPPQHLRRLVLRLHPLLERRHRELDLSGLRGQRRAAQHPVARHRLEGSQQLGRLGVEHDAVPRPRRFLQWAAPTASTSP